LTAAVVVAARAGYHQGYAAGHEDWVEGLTRFRERTAQEKMVDNTLSAFDVAELVPWVGSSPLARTEPPAAWPDPEPAGAGAGA
jgi:hypothetical protein